MSTYNHKKIENNWKDHWYDNNLYEAVDFSEKPKKYILAELPYPSGPFLHLGHMMRYTVPDIYARFLRLQGYNVMFPMGWDSFGLPGETFAIKQKSTPQKVIPKATQDFKKAMQGFGFNIDWNRELNTSDPAYYKWTQWMFIKLWKEGLAEQRKLPVWWCKELGVLADEEVLPDGNGGKVSERGGYAVEKKVFKQWVLKIPKYADKLLDGLNEVDYFESVKEGQRNWIGKKEGINIEYEVDLSDAKAAADMAETITCFTTRPDTNFGATFVVVSPEHAFVDKILDKDLATKDTDFDEIEKYVKEAKEKSDLERMADGRNKTGVFTGFYVLNKLNNKRLPVWISDFVLPHFGTGAVVGVPGHDLRDFEFATKFNLEIVRVVVGPDGDKGEIDTIEKVQHNEGTVINSDFLDGMPIKDAISKVMDHIEKGGWGTKTTTYSIRDQIFSRQRYWGEPIPLIYKEDGTIEADDDLPLELPDMQDFQTGEDGNAPLAKDKAWVTTTAADGAPAKRETDTMPTWAGSNWYFIRYIDPKNDKEFADPEKMKYWLPIDKYFGDAGHTTAHLIYSRFWYRFLHDQGLVPTKEPYQWRMSGGMLLGTDGKKMSKSRPECMVDPKLVVENYGADVIRTYLAFLGPYEDSYPWNENGIKAIYRLVKTIYEMQDKVSKDKVDMNVMSNKALQKAYHKMIKKMTPMMEELKMNTAVSQIMIFVKHLKQADTIDQNIWKGFITAVAPFMPFVTEDLWQNLHGFKEWKNENSVHLQDWPKFDENLAKDALIELPIQINGKLRGAIEIELDTAEKDIEEMVMEDEKIKKYLDGKPVKKFVYIVNRIVNLVV